MRKENYFVGVRFNKDKQLFNKLNENDLSNSELIRKSLYQYFRTMEPNQTIDSFGDSDESYNKDYLDLLKQSLKEKNNYIDFLQTELQSLTVIAGAKVPLLAKIKTKILNDRKQQ